MEADTRRSKKRWAASTACFDRGRGDHANPETKEQIICSKFGRKRRRRGGKCRDNWSSDESYPNRSASIFGGMSFAPLVADTSLEGPV